VRVRDEREADQPSEREKLFKRQRVSTTQIHSICGDHFVAANIISTTRDDTWSVLTALRSACMGELLRTSAEPTPCHTYVVGEHSECSYATSGQSGCRCSVF
jgi:hypothetical protein